MGISDEQFRDALVQQVRVELVELRMSQAGLAAATGIGPQSMSRYMQGHREVPLPTFRKIASALKLDASELMRRVEARANREKAET